MQLTNKQTNSRAAFVRSDKALTVMLGIPLRASGMAAPRQTHTRSPTWLRDADAPVDGDEQAPAAKPRRWRSAS